MDKKFETYPTYSGQDLELTVDNRGTTFRLWSPEAGDARHHLSERAQFRPLRDSPHEKGDNGVWTANSPERLYGKFYTFQILWNGTWLDETPGVWAKAVGTNGQRAAIIDFATTNPDGWENDRGRP